MSSIWYFGSWIYTFIRRFPYSLYGDHLQHITYPIISNIQKFEKEHGLIMDRKFTHTTLEDGTDAMVEEDQVPDPSITSKGIDETMDEIQEDFIASIDQQIDNFIVINDPDEIYIDKEVESGLDKFQYTFVPQNINVMNMYMMIYSKNVKASIKVNKPNAELDIYYIEYTTEFMLCQSWWHRYNNTLYTHNSDMVNFFEENPKLVIVAKDDIHKYAST